MSGTVELARIDALIHARKVREARTAARELARQDQGAARWVAAAMLVGAYATQGQAIRARRLQRWLVRRLPGVPQLEQDYIGLLGTTGAVRSAYARLAASEARRADPAAWRGLDAQLPPGLILAGMVEEAWSLSVELVQAGVRGWPTLVALAWAGGALGRLTEAMALVEAAAPTLVDRDDEELGYRFLRTCAAHGGEGRAARWLLSAPEADAFEWAAPYRRRAGLTDLSNAAREAVVGRLATGAPPAAPVRTVHLVCDFPNAVGGAEEHVLDLAELLRPSARVAVWATRFVHPAYAARGVRLLTADAPVDAGGLLCVIGGWHAPGDWLARFSPERVALHCNTLNAPQTIRLISALGERSERPVELGFASNLIRRELGLPGGIEISPIPPERQSLRAPRRSGPVVVGRLSRDSFDKHHAEDPEVYRALLARGLRVRVLGGTSLAGRLTPHPALRLLPAEPGATPAFLATLEVFFYRTGAWTEPCARAIFEAMREGVPVVVDDAGGHAEFIRNGVDGYVVRSTEEALERILDLCDDAGLRDVMGAAARARFLTLYGEGARSALRRRYLGG